MALIAGLPVAPILATLRHHRSTTTLLVLQISLTLAILCNGLFIVQTHLAHQARETGIDEANIGVIHNQWTSAASATEISARIAADLTRLRQLPDVVDAYSDYSYPAAGPWAKLLQVSTQPNQIKPTSLAELYTADEHTLVALGLDLLGGRAFRAEEIVAVGNLQDVAPASILITQDLAAKLYPDSAAIGKTVYLGATPVTVIGIVRQLQVPAVNTNRFAYRSVLAPVRVSANTGSYYLIRAKNGKLNSVLQNAVATLRNDDPRRLIDPNGGVQPYRALRAAAYARDRGVATLMLLLCTILLIATTGGIVGLSSFWVQGRTRQIGIRRALGARRIDILSYFLVENFLIVTPGIAFGMALAYGLNLWLMQRFEIARLPWIYLPVGAIALWVTGQLAALGPARRAASIPPAIATRAA